MKKYALTFLALIISLLTITTSFANETTLQTQLSSILSNYIKQYQKVEHISAAAITVSTAPGKFVSAYAGTTEYNGQGKPINSNTLFQIGSITKSFTAAIILKLEAQKKLNINDTVSQYFPKYKQWRDITIRQLLNMTSGIPNYSEMPNWSKREGNNIQAHFLPEELLAAAENKPLQSGYNYTNTSYILAGMIAAKVSQQPFVSLMHDFIKHSKLNNTYYYQNIYPASITNRMPSGYYYNITDPDLNRLILSKADPDCSQGSASTDLKCNNMSWAGAAGGIVSNTVDITPWARMLFTPNKLLPNKQLQELKSIVSQKTGQPISQTSENDSYGFGLGVVQAYKPKLGVYWYYEGETLGYRMLYAYFPKRGLIITVALNSQTVPCEDHISELLLKAYQLVTR